MIDVAPQHYRRSYRRTGSHRNRSDRRGQPGAGPGSRSNGGNGRDRPLFGTVQFPLTPPSSSDGAPDGQPIITVTELTKHIKHLIMHDPKLTNIWVVGEVSNFKHHSSGHMYFSLKDHSAQLRCVFFSSHNARCAFEPQSGQKVIARGYVDIYETRGEYQLYVLELLPHGVGSLYLAYLQLKKRLEKEGLFAPERKRPLPTFPRRVGVITSATGAALRDILRVLSRRFPTEVLLFPALVQGDAAAPSIVAAIRRAHRHDVPRPDVLILGRGGGSIEDLWAFNTEPVARAIFDATIPIIAAVGHETDHTIADFVADARAPTPSAAAERAVPDRAELHQRLQDRLARLTHHLTNLTRTPRLLLEQLARTAAFQRPYAVVHQRAERLDELDRRLTAAMERFMATQRTRVTHAAATLRNLDPYTILKRGYAIAQNRAVDPAAVVTDIGTVAPGDPLAIRVANGIVYATVTGSEPVARSATATKKRDDEETKNTKSPKNTAESPSRSPSRSPRS